MISHRDMTFCSSSDRCGTRTCIRHFDAKAREQTRADMAAMGEKMLPVCLSDFWNICDKKTEK